MIKKVLLFSFIISQMSWAMAQPPEVITIDPTGTESVLALANADKNDDNDPSIVGAPLESDTGLLVLEGTYQGKNIYVNNPSNAYENDFAVFRVMVNGRKVHNIASSNFVINLSNYEVGKFVKIEIAYKAKGYPPPQVLNAGVIRSRSTYELIEVSVNESSITWSTKNETSQESYIIERDIGSGLWSDWVLVGTVVGNGSRIYNEYTFAVEHFSGENKYRIKQRDGIYQYSYLPPIKHFSSKPRITLAEKNVKAKLKLSVKTEYEIYDAFGRLITKGKGKVIDVSGIRSGTYFIKIENKTDTFVKN